MKAKDIISSISEEWFLNEPLFFEILCSHKLVENPKISIPFRTGKGRIEYNPLLVEENEKDAMEMLQCEIYRILLKHPYERVPIHANRTALKKASDITIAENCPNTKNLQDAKYYGLEKKQSYEDYYKNLKDIYPDYRIDNLLGDSCDSIENKGDFEGAELWEDNEKISRIVQNKIDKAVKTGLCGNIGGKLIEKILVSKNVPMNYKRILTHFRTSMMSNNRTLTRFRVNRRYGFDYMGSRYKEAYNLLIAVDASGSIGKEDLENFFSVINNFFKYGAKKIYVIVFDYYITQEMELKKAKSSLQIEGRGGTNFQPAIDFYEKSSEYDGLIILTDGYAPPPNISKRKRILWILNDEHSYKVNKIWIEKLPASLVTWIKKPLKQVQGDSKTMSC